MLRLVKICNGYNKPKSVALHRRHRRQNKKIRRSATQQIQKMTTSIWTSNLQNTKMSTSNPATSNILTLHGLCLTEFLHVPKFNIQTQVTLKQFGINSLAFTYYQPT